jgi:acetoacetyl-CoA synthetase
MSRLDDFSLWLGDRKGLSFQGFDELWRWSVDDLKGFWSAVREFFEVRFTSEPAGVLGRGAMPGAEWFPGARISFAGHVLRAASERPALIAVTEDGATQTWSWARLERETAAIADHLRGLGVSPGDRVVGYLPNGPHAIVAFLAAASLGAVWSICNLDVPVPGVLQRFQQLSPTVLVAAEGCTYGGRYHDRRDAISEIVLGLPTLKGTVVVGQPVPGAVTWEDAVAGDAELETAQVPFDHPLWVLFSSGTTGAPKGIVHGHGGVLLEQLLFLGLHLDLGPDDVFFWHCSTSWVMWNIVASALLTGATVVLYDGSPTSPGPDRLWDLAEEHRVSVLGVSPAYLVASAQAGLEPGTQHDLSALRVLGCTGAPLPAAMQEWVGQHVREDLPVNSLSGGTDVAGPFVSANPWVAAEPGEIAARCLGVALEVWDDEGRPVVDEPGELVVTRPMPSMPLRLWGDEDGTRLRETYFDTYPGVWRQGDSATLTARGSVVIHGRSDATLNRQGVRLGTTEIYQAVEALPEVVEALVVGVEEPDGGYWMPMFVQLQQGVELDHALRSRFAQAIRTHASARHVPDEVVAVEALPHTLTGKRLEVPIKRILSGRPAAAVVNSAAVDRPELLAVFEDLARARRA